MLARSLASAPCHARVFPYALSCHSGYTQWASSFRARWHKLRALAPQLRQAAAEEGGALTFVPESPACSQCHCFLGAGYSLEALDRARDAVDMGLGARVYERLRDANDALCLSRPKDVDDAALGFVFEWSLGPEHLDVPDETFILAWRAFFRELRTAAAAAD